MRGAPPSGRAARAPAVHAATIAPAINMQMRNANIAFLEQREIQGYGRVTYVPQRLKYKRLEKKNGVRTSIDDFRTIIGGSPGQS